MPVNVEQPHAHTYTHTCTPHASSNFASAESPLFESMSPLDTYFGTLSRNSACRDDSRMQDGGNPAIAGAVIVLSTTTLGTQVSIEVIGPADVAIGKVGGGRTTSDC